MGYLCVLKTKTLGSTTYVQSTELLNDYNKWWENVMPTIINKIKHANLKILPNGLESANEGLQMSRESKVSGEKIVLKFKNCQIPYVCIL